MATKKKKSVKKKAAGKAAKGKKKAVKRASAKPKKASRKKPSPAKKARKPVKKKSAPKKKSSAKKKAPARKKASVKKKTAAKKKPAAAKKKAVAPKKKAAPKKQASAKKAAAPFALKKNLPPPPPPPFAPSRVAALASAKRKRNIKKLTAKELKEFRQALLNLRDKVVDGISFLSGDNLNRSQRDASGDLSGYSLHMADQGTDNYDREFALNLVSSEQDILYEIDEAIRRLDSGKYGVCELTGEPIERARLKVLPYARFSVVAQSEMERGKTRYRPFGPTLTHGG